MKIGRKGSVGGCLNHELSPYLTGKMLMVPNNLRIVGESGMLERQLKSVELEWNISSEGDFLDNI